MNLLRLTALINYNWSMPKINNIFPNKCMNAIINQMTLRFLLPKDQIANSKQNPDMYAKFPTIAKQSPALKISFFRSLGRVPLDGIRTNPRDRRWVLDLVVGETNSNCYCWHASKAPPCWVCPSPGRFHGLVGGLVSAGGWDQPIEPVNIDDWSWRAQRLHRRYGSYPFHLLEQRSRRHNTRPAGNPSLVSPVPAFPLLRWARRISFHGGCCSGCVLPSRLTEVDRN